jgi:1-acyl-sn-glycerol-3-phosphate acyltransferase
MNMKDNGITPFASRAMAGVRVAGFLALVVLMIPVHIVCGWLKPSQPFRTSQVFHRVLMKVLVLFVANHASYLDIPVLGSLLPAAFVAKAEVAEWPLIGTLARLQHTVFIERRATRAGEQRDHLRMHLEQGQNLVLFPEGTSSIGLSALPFKSSLFSIVEDMPADRAVTVQPISITCTELDGLPMTRAMRPFYAWYGDMEFTSHLWNVFRMGRFTVDVIFHPPLMVKDFADRKVLASACQKQVAQGIDQLLTGRNRTVLPGALPKLLARA